jgi:GNAT superfamily N-acetyltransferase
MEPGLREFDLDRDVTVLSALLSESTGEDVSVTETREWFAKRVSGSVFCGVVATDGTAYADTFRQPWHADGQFTARVYVAGEDRGRGLGTRLLTEITDYARTHGAGHMRGLVSERNADGVRFAERHGFRVLHHHLESRLDPKTVSRELLIRPAADGIIVASLQELGDDEANRHAYWELYENLAADMPGKRPRRSYALFSEQVFQASWFRPEAQFVAVAGDLWVGIGSVSYRPATNSLYHQFTGVTPGFRGRRVATALKCATIAYALEIGADYLTAKNDATNAPMLAVNRALGYVPQLGSYDVVRRIESTP